MHGTDAADGQQGCNVGVVMHWTKHLLGLKPLTSPQAVDPHLPERIADVLIKVFPGALHVRWPTGHTRASWNMHWTSCQQTAQLPAVSTASKQTKLTRLSLTGLTMVQINK